MLLIGIIVVAAAVFGAVFYAVYSAPTFFAELLIDGGVGTWLYKRADVAHRPDWLSTAVRRSVWSGDFVGAVCRDCIRDALRRAWCDDAGAGVACGERGQIVGRELPLPLLQSLHE